MKDELHSLQTTLGYFFSDCAPLEAALVHPSYAHEQDSRVDHNQRLEFLGDAVIGLLCADYLYHRFPSLHEGDLTRLRSAVSNRRALARIARRIPLGRYLLLGRGERLARGEDRPALLADAMEAVFGAAYADGGLPAARQLFDRLILPEIQGVLDSLTLLNPKGMLQEFAQRRWKTSPVYRLVGQDGPAHARRFTVQVALHNIVMGSGQGTSKRSAEIEAARAAVHRVLSASATEKLPTPPSLIRRPRLPNPDAT